MTAIYPSNTSTAEAASKPLITIIVSPQEHFGYTQQSLDSIYKNTKVPFELIYVDTGSPKHIQNYLVQAATRYNFTLLRCDYFLTSNRARNLGLSQVSTDYIVFLSNDICVSPGWLERLWNCAQEMDAAAVYPAIYTSTQLPIQPASDKTRILMDIQDEHIHNHLYKRPPLTSCLSTDTTSQNHRQHHEVAELSCLLVKRTVIEQIGYLDPNLLGPQADLDFCLSISYIDKPVFCETASVVTYVPQKPKHWSDWYCFMMRWSDTWELESLIHFHQKWELDMDYYFHQHYRYLGQHRHQTYLYPLLRQLPRDSSAFWFKQLVIDLEKWVNQTLTDRHTQLSDDAIAKLVPTAATSAQSFSFRQILQQTFSHDNPATTSQAYLSQ